MRQDRQPKPRPLLVAGVVCVCAMLLTAGLAQSLDSCELAALQSARQIAAADSIRAPGSCLICVAAHSAPLLTSPPVVSIVALSAPAQASPHTVASTVQIFALYVRPPPAA